MYPDPYMGYNFVKPSLFSSFRGIKWSSILDSTGKTLGVINQAIPIVYQVKPLVSNARSMFKIANIINDDTPNTTSDVSTINEEVNKPIFYI